ALFGDRVQSIFMLDGKLFAAVDLLVQQLDGFLGEQAVRTLAVEYRVLPVAVYAADGSVQPQPLDAHLHAGARLVAITALADLERLFRREIGGPSSVTALKVSPGLPAAPPSPPC